MDVAPFFKVVSRRGQRLLRAAKEEVRARSKGWCEAGCSGVCQGRATEFHHRLMRSQGGPDTADNGMDVCAACHRWIHANPEWAYRVGFLLRRLAS